MTKIFRTFVALSLFVLVVMGCVQGDGAEVFGRIRAEEASGPCPTGMLLMTPPAEVELGEWDVPEGQEGMVVPLTAFHLHSYCVEEYPFPGKGHLWPRESLYQEHLPVLLSKLQGTGMRLCSPPELLYASAGEGNWRFSMHPETYVPGVCEGNDQYPSPNEIGAWGSCVSPMGAHDFDVRSSWGVTDWETLTAVAPLWPEELFAEAYVVVGGVARQDTYHPPGNAALRAGPLLAEGVSYWDSGLRLCADPDPSGERVGREAEEAVWAQVVEEFEMKDSSFVSWLDPEENPISPATPEEEGVEPKGTLCPKGMLLMTPPAEVELGEKNPELIEEYGGGRTVVSRVEYRLHSYCVAEYPFPGVVGEMQPVDGLCTDQRHALTRELGRMNVRLCTAGELLYAAAGEENWRYPYDPEVGDLAGCDGDGEYPIGSFPDCQSPTGAWDFTTRSFMAVVDPVTASVVAPAYGGLLPYLQYYEEGEEVVAFVGGFIRPLGQLQPYYGPGNFGIHIHPEGESDADYRDDSFRACATPRASRPSGWAAWEEHTASFWSRYGGSYEAWLGVGHN